MDKKIINNFANYIVLILKEWIFWIGLLFTGASFITYLFPGFNIGLPRYLVLTFSGLMVFIATYRVWGREKTEKEKLLESLVQFKFDYEVKPISLGEEFIILDKEKKLAEERIASFNKKDFFIISAFNNFLLLPKKDWEQYLKELEDYKQKLQKFQRKYEYAYHLQLIITNIGSKSDENVEITIKAPENLTFLKSGEIEEIKQGLPGRPQTGLTRLMQKNIEMYPARDNGGPFKRYINIFNKQEIVVDISLLRVGDSVEVIYGGFYIKIDGKIDSIHIPIEIRSKNLKKTDEKNLEIKL